MALYGFAARQTGWHRSRGTAFLIGVGLTALALESPLHRLGECCLLAAHMIQHMVLLLLAPPLVIWGLGEWIRHRGPAPSWLAVLVHPAVALTTALVNLYVWHVPSLHQLALESAPVHNLQHVLFVVTGIQFWWRVVCPAPSQAAFLAQAASRFLYLVGASFGMMPLGLILLIAPTPLYPRYAGLASVFGWSPLADQQMAALFMLFGGGTILVGAVTAGFIVLSRGSADRPLVPPVAAPGGHTGQIP